MWWLSHSWTVMKARLEPTVGSLQSSSPSASLRQVPQTTTRRQQYFLLVDGEIRELTQTVWQNACLALKVGMLAPARSQPPPGHPRRRGEMGGATGVGGARSRAGLRAEPCSPQG